MFLKQPSSQANRNQSILKNSICHKHLQKDSWYKALDRCVVDRLWLEPCVTRLCFKNCFKNCFEPCWNAYLNKRRRLSLGRRLTTEEFIEKARDVHGDKYDYSEVVYKNNKEKITIICKVHGAFYQTPASHLSRRGCCSCHADSIRSSLTEFTEKSKKIHNGRYDYSRVTYKHRHKKVTIVCKGHGVFHQTPGSHLSGHGCPSCPYNYDLPTNVYILEGNDLTKIGVSQNIERRMNQQSRSQPFTSTLVASFLCKDYPSALSVEKAVHKKLSHKNAGLEGFDGATEWFKVTPAETADLIKQEIDLCQCSHSEAVI